MDNSLYKFNTGNLTVRMEEIINLTGLESLNIDKNMQTEIPVICYSMRLKDKMLLFDSGLHQGRNSMGFSEGMKYQPRPEKKFLASLKHQKYDIYLSHLHSDHVGNLDKINYGTVVTYCDELEAAKHSHNGYHKKLLSGIKFQELFPEQFQYGNYPFKYFDMYNDGSFYVFYTPGHTVGHLSFMVNNGDFKILFGGDICEGYLGLKYPVPGLQADWDLYHRNIQFLIEWLKQDPNLLLLVSHETEINKLLMDGVNDENQLEHLANYQESRLKSLNLI